MRKDAMAEVTNDLIYDVLQSMQTRLGRMDIKLDEVKLELHAIRGHQVAIQQDVSVIYSRLGHIEDRVERVDRRLGLVDPAH